jgi:hypothetical protein
MPVSNRLKKWPLTPLPRSSEGDLSDQDVAAGGRLLATYNCNYPYASQAP